MIEGNYRLGEAPPITPIQGGGISVSGAKGQTNNDPSSLGGGAFVPAVNRASLYTPFQIILGADASRNIYAVVLSGILYSDYWDSTSTKDITGIIDPSSMVAPPATGWTALTENTKVYLECAIASYLVTTATVKIDNDYVGGTWVTRGDLQNDGGTPPTQTFARRLIGNLTTNGAAWTIDQRVYTHLGMNSDCFKGEAGVSIVDA